MGFKLTEIIDAKRLNEELYSFRTYLNKDHNTEVYKIVICGLERSDRIAIFGRKETALKKLDSLIKCLLKTKEKLSKENLL
jgi:hypothetical protein